MSSTVPAPAENRFAVLVPVKPPAVAKSRLAALGDEARRRLATAFAVDTVTAALSCRSVDRVLVVTDDHSLAADLAALGVDTLPDGITDDLNTTLRLAAAEMHRRRPTLWLAALCADLPALRADELDLVLSNAAAGRMTFVADQDGVGTTAVLASSAELFVPLFGPGSRRRHLEAGAKEADGIDVPTVRRDVDDRTDLAEAVRLGVGAHTAAVLAALHLDVS